MGNGYNSSPQIVTYILQKAFFKHALEVGVFLLEKDKYYKNHSYFQIMRRMCALIQLDNVDYITYNKDKELMQNKNKRWE